MADAHLTADTPKPTVKPNREARRRAARSARARERKLRAERRKSLSDPDGDDTIKPAGVSVRDFRRMVGISHATAHRWIKAGSIKSVRINGRRLIAFDEVARVRAGE